ncbi:hypothetical protein COLO4_04171 [Corchorus olitorius]|uniref:Uncharacterized protein n=1 Tax=Corchorus olitorius TaxID=93759 RepID=A0A1R3KV48_9ROSI|nr:hypothetical protein COLO4_04171 [Corchorus olitorius]
MEPKPFFLEDPIRSQLIDDIAAEFEKSSKV